MSTPINPNVEPLLKKYYIGTADESDALRALKMFNSFYSSRFDFEWASRESDNITYASHRTLLHFLPSMISAYLASDRSSCIIFPIISALDPFHKNSIYGKRSELLRVHADSKLISSVNDLINHAKSDGMADDGIIRAENYWR